MLAPTQTQPTFYPWPQQLAQRVFIALLAPHLPHSNPIYNRLISPQNTAERNCLFAATFPPPSINSTGSNGPGIGQSNITSLPKQYEQWTLLFADRTRKQESQVWIFNPLSAISIPLSQPQQETLTQHLSSALQFLRLQGKLQHPSSLGYPFGPVVRIACVPPSAARSLLSLATPYNAVAHATVWELYTLSLSSPRLSSSAVVAPAGFKFSRVPERDLDIVLGTSNMNRQKATLLELPNMAILTDEGSQSRLVAWAYVNLDGSISTLYCLPEFRGRGFAKMVAGQLLRALRDGEFALALSSSSSDFSEGDEKAGKNAAGGEGEARLVANDGRSGFVHGDVAKENEGSKGVMRGLGGTSTSENSYIWIDLEKIPYLVGQGKKEI